MIQQYLQNNELTQRAFADALGCTTAFVNGLVNGKNTDIKISLLKKIHDQTKIPMPDLVEHFLSFKDKPKSGLKKR